MIRVPESNRPQFQIEFQQIRTRLYDDSVFKVKIVSYRIVLTHCPLNSTYFRFNLTYFWLKDLKKITVKLIKRSKKLNLIYLYQLFWLHSITFDIFLIDFELFNQIRIWINKIRHNTMDSDNEFGSKNSIKIQFKSDFRQILGVSQFNHLSLPRYFSFSDTNHSLIIPPSFFLRSTMLQRAYRSPNHCLNLVIVSVQFSRLVKTT